MEVHHRESVSWQVWIAVFQVQGHSEVLNTPKLKKYSLIFSELLMILWLNLLHTLVPHCGLQGEVWISNLSSRGRSLDFRLQSLKAQRSFFHSTRDELLRTLQPNLVCQGPITKWNVIWSKSCYLQVHRGHVFWTIEPHHLKLDTPSLVHRYQANWCVVAIKVRVTGFRFKSSRNVSPSGIFWTAKPFVAIFGMLVGRLFFKKSFFFYCLSQSRCFGSLLQSDAYKKRRSQTWNASESLVNRALLREEFGLLYLRSRWQAWILRRTSFVFTWRQSSEPFPTKLICPGEVQSSEPFPTKLICPGEVAENRRAWGPTWRRKA